MTAEGRLPGPVEEERTKLQQMRGRLADAPWAHQGHVLQVAQKAQRLPDLAAAVEEVIVLADGAAVKEGVLFSTRETRRTQSLYSFSVVSAPLWLVTPWQKLHRDFR